MIAFGPIPSRRLGKSLGINNIPGTKVCTYSCIYCQVGSRCRMTDVRRSFYEPRYLIQEIAQHLGLLQDDDKPDFLTFVSNGEPTLDIHLGEEIDLLKAFGIPVAVITNGSLLIDPLLRQELRYADWVSVKVDAGDAEIRNRINRPIPSSGFDTYVEGLLKFSEEFSGHLVTETMLVDGVNDGKSQLMDTIQLISRVKPAQSYLAIPTRPPPSLSVKSPPEEKLIQAYRLFTDAGLSGELLTGFEGTSFGHTGNVWNDILTIVGVHPLRDDAMQELLRKNRADEVVVQDLIRENLIREVYYDNHHYYIRKYSGK